MKHDKAYLELLRMIMTSGLPNETMAEMIEILRNMKKDLKIQERRRIITELKKTLEHHINCTCEI